MATVVLDDFEGGMRTTGGHNLWETYFGEGAGGSCTVTTGAKHNGSNGLNDNLTTGTRYMHFYCNNGSEWAFAKELLTSGSWTGNTFNRMSFWVQHPANQPSSTPNPHLVEFGTYVRSANGNRATQNDGGTHYYHYYNPRPSVWTKVLVDFHPQHFVGGPTSDPGVVQYPTGGSSHNYFDALTRFYWDVPYAAPSGYPSVMFYDDFEFYTDSEANEDIANIASLEASWNSGTDLLHVGFCRNSADDTTYTAKWATSDIHALGWSNATTFGTSGVDGQGDYVTKRIEGTVDLAAVSTVYIGVQKSGNSTFRQIVLELSDAPPDTTAPTLSSPNAGTPNSAGTINASVSTNEGNGTLYWAVVTNGGSATDTQLKAGSGGNIVAGVAGSQNVGGTGTQTVSSITGLAASTLYQIKFLHSDAAANDSSQSSVNLTTTAGDTTAPVLTSPTSGTATSDGCSGAGVTTDEGNGTLYWAVVTDGGSCTDAQLKAGSGGNIVAGKAGNQAVSSTGAKTIPTITGLSASTAYQLKFLHTDAAANDSAQASANLTTNAGPDVTAPVLTNPTTGTPTLDGCSDAGVDTDEPNGILYWAFVLDGGSATDQQLIDGVGGDILIFAHGQQDVTEIGFQGIPAPFTTIINLSPGVDYQVLFLQQDAAANNSDQVSADLTTLGGFRAAFSKVNQQVL